MKVNSCRDHRDNSLKIKWDYLSYRRICHHWKRSKTRPSKLLVNLGVSSPVSLLRRCSSSSAASVTSAASRDVAAGSSKAVRCIWREGVSHWCRISDTQSVRLLHSFPAFLTTSMNLNNACALASKLIKKVFNKKSTLPESWKVFFRAFHAPVHRHIMQLYSVVLHKRPTKYASYFAKTTYCVC